MLEVFVTSEHKNHTTDSCCTLVRCDNVTSFCLNTKIIPQTAVVLWYAVQCNSHVERITVIAQNTMKTN